LFWKFKNLSKIYLKVNRIPLLNNPVLEENTYNVEDVYVLYNADF
jgi:hypothetical protein